MKQIPLTQGYFTLVDDEDFEELSKYKWHVNKIGNKFYAKRGIKLNGKNKTFYMHSIIAETPHLFHTDHIDGDGLNNQRSNLRICTHSNNIRNRGKASNNTSGFKGVHWNKQYNKWMVQIRVEGKVKFLGRFHNKIEAYKVYCEAVKKYHGEFAHL